MVNIDPTIRIRWWGPKKIGGLPTHLHTHETFKDIELVDWVKKCLIDEQEFDHLLGM